MESKLGRISLNPGRIFYGWWIIAACFVSSIYIAGVVVFGFTAFFDPLIQEFGWSYAQVSLAASLRGAETGLAAPVLGFLVDKWGSKWLLLAGAVFTGVGMILLSRINSLGAFYGAFVIVAIGTSFCSPAVVTPPASNWFRRRLGLATGILAAGFAFGGLLLPLIIQLIDDHGWRLTMLALGIGALVICIPLAFVVRHRPEKYGYGPDGVPLSDSSNPGKAAKTVTKPPMPETEISAGQALKSRTFWQLTLAFTFQYVVISAILAHIMPFLNTVNIDRSTAGFFAAAIPVVSVGGRLGSGWLSDKLNRKQVTVGAFATICIGTLLFDYVTSSAIWLLVLAVVIFALSYGSANTLRAVLLREYFGRSRFGTIFGFLMGALSLGSILGPFLAGWIFDNRNSYHLAWWLFTALNVVSLILLITTPKMKIKAKARESQAAASP